MPESILTIENLTKVYRRSHLGRTKLTRGVEDLSLSVQKGEIYGLVGLNGSGKTTTLKLILGLLFPTKGSVHILEHKVPHPFAQQRIGYLPEVPYFYRNLTPAEVLRLYGALSKMKPKTIEGRIDEVLSLVSMSHAKNKPMREFSKGMLQRIGLAQALIHNPDFLILDEPVTGLDPLGLKHVRAILLDLNKKGKTILLSSHSMNELEKMAHRVGILVQGRLVRELEKKDWEGSEGKLEETFVRILEENGAAVVS